MILSMICFAVLAVGQAQGAVKVVELNSALPPSFSLQDDSDGSGTYVVGISKTAMPEEPTGRPFHIVSANGTKFTCFLPARDGAADATTTTTSSSSSSTVPAAASGLFQEKTPEELMDDLGEWCAYRVEDWWTYEFCYKKAARQYHSEGGKVMDSYFLGNYSAADSDMASPSVDSAVGAEVKYVMQAYLGGAACEVTGANRSVEVRYVCGRGGQTVITEVREPSSCSYVFTLSTPRLCKHPAFQETPQRVVPIACYPVDEFVGASGQAMPKRKSEEAEAEQQQQHEKLELLGDSIGGVGSGSEEAVQENSTTAAGAGVEDGDGDLGVKIELNNNNNNNNDEL